MKLHIPVLLTSILLLAGCSQTQHLSLEQIQPVRVFTMTKGDALETARLYCVKEGFRVDSFEEETGRVIAHRTQQEVTSVETGKMIIMNLRIVAVDAQHTEVTTRFTYSSVNDALNREQQEILADCYTLLYYYLDQKAK
jgi:hypothetical protein